MRVKYPAMHAELESHTVDTPRGRLAGFLVRCTSSRKDLGYVWSAGTTWRWQLPDGQHHGERGTQQAAVRVLRDAHDLKQQPSLLTHTPTVDDIKAAWRAPILVPKMKPRRPDPTPWTQPHEWHAKPSAPAPPTKPAPPAQHAPVSTAPPVKKIDWSKQGSGDVTAALAAALRRKETK